MAKKQQQTASFMIRFHQEIFEEKGESIVQWKGKISHIQEGDEKRFADFKDALKFIQKKLNSLTKEATKNKPQEEQENILQKSLSMWKTIKQEGPKVLKETLKDTKKQLHHLQDQLQEQFTTIGEEISEKVQIDEWKNASKSDMFRVQQQIEDLAAEIKKMSKKINTLKK